MENKRKAKIMMFATRLEMDSRAAVEPPKYRSFVCLFTEFADAAFGSNELMIQSRPLFIRLRQGNSKRFQF